jgi:hypothetical protein
LKYTKRQGFIKNLAVFFGGCTSWRTLTKRSAGEECLRTLTNAPKGADSHYAVRGILQPKRKLFERPHTLEAVKQKTVKVPQLHLQHSLKYRRFTPRSLKNAWPCIASGLANAAALGGDLGQGFTQGLSRRHYRRLAGRYRRLCEGSKNGC